MKEQFVTYEIALKLKELGFDEACLYSFEYGNGGLECKLNPQLKTNSTCDIGELVVPLWQQAFDWLFKKLEFKYPYLKLEIYSDNSGSWTHKDGDNFKSLDISFDNLEEALELILNKTRNE